MDTAGKLQLIKQLLGLTQEKLAQRIGVSFATVNSWINAKSTPRESKQKLIDLLYVESTGLKNATLTSLLAKKKIINRKTKKMRNLLKYLNSRKDITDQFMLSLTYNTNRIEGNTLTEPETAALLFDNVALPNRNIIEQLEVKNHQAALNYLFQYLHKSKTIGEELLLKLHAILMNGIKEDAGYYRTHGVRIVGSNVPTANYLKVPQLMKGLVKNIRSANEEIISHVSKTHSLFEQIHPFSDGNGRIGRLVIHAMLLKKNLPPAVIRQEKKRAYIKNLNESQSKGDFSNLEEFLCDAILEGFDIIEKGE